MQEKQIELNIQALNFNYKSYGANVDPIQSIFIFICLSFIFPRKTKKNTNYLRNVNSLANDNCEKLDCIF